MAGQSRNLPSSQGALLLSSNGEHRPQHDISAAGYWVDIEWIHSRFRIRENYDICRFFKDLLCFNSGPTRQGEGLLDSSSIHRFLRVKENPMLYSRQKLIIAVRIGFLWGVFGLLTLSASTAVADPLLFALPPESGCAATEAWNEVIEGPSRWVAAMDGAAYCDRQTGLVWETAAALGSFTWLDAIERCLNRTVNGQNGTSNG
jgi:hypothetical protein